MPGPAPKLRGRRRSHAGCRRLRRSGGLAALLGVLALGAGACGPGDAASAAGGGSRASGGGNDGATRPAPAVDSAEIAAAIDSMLTASTGSWNAGDLDGFLDDYTAGPDLTFTGSSGVTRGRASVRERYEASYWAEGAERDSLRFEGLEVRPLGKDHALALGRYVLYRPEAGDSVTATGPFTLVLRREGAGWRIVHDHSS